MEKGVLFLNVALFVGPQYSEQNQSEANNEKTSVVSYNDDPALPWDGHIFVPIFSVGLKMFCYGCG